MTRRLAAGVAALLAAAVTASTATLAARAQDAFASAGGTTVAVDGSVVTITVTIDLLLGGLGETELPEGAQESADELGAAIAGYWNGGFGRLATDCVEFRLVVEINALPMVEHRILVIDDDRLTSVTTPGHHVVIWGVNNFGNAAPPLTYDPYDADGYAPPGEDYGSPYEHELYADWSPRLESARDFAHEFGHLLGFGDDYGEGGEALPGRAGTLMADGDLIDGNLVSRLGRLVRGTGAPVPECWTGTYTGTVEWDCGPLGTRTGELEGSFKLSVAGSGIATMNGENTVTGSCAGPSAGRLTTPFTVTGERTGGLRVPRHAVGTARPPHYRGRQPPRLGHARGCCPGASRRPAGLRARVRQLLIGVSGRLRRAAG